MSEAAPPILPEWIERVIPTGPDRAVIDLFRGVGTPGTGRLIQDFDQTYRVEMVLISETPCSGGRVLTRVVGPEDG